MELSGAGCAGRAARHRRVGVSPRDPHFVVKAARVLDLYGRVFDGEPLGESDYVLSADEKPGVQARSRIHPSRPPGPGRPPMRVESECRRRGTLAYLAACYNTAARPFDWRFNRNDLNRLLTRIAA